MAITKMKRFSLLTFHEHKTALLKELQKFGDVHFKKLGREELEGLDFLLPDASPDSILRCEAELDNVGFALSKLAPFAPKRSLTAKRPTLEFAAFDRYLEDYDYKSVCGAVKAAEERAASIHSEIARLHAENDALRIWLRLDVSPAQLESFDSVRPLVGMLNKSLADAFATEIGERFGDVYTEFLGSVKDDVAVLLLIPAERYDEVFSFAKDTGFSRANLTFDGVPARLIDRNLKRIEELERERGDVRAGVERLGPEHERLLIVRDYFRTRLAREKATENFLSTGSVVLAEGWLPEEEVERFHGILQGVCGDDFYTELSDVDEECAEVPIKLKNNRLVGAFESITAMYAMPRYHEFDPTPILMPFYWLFFGLMVGDIGYGILLVAATALVLKLVDLSGGMKKFLQFFHYLSYGVILGGVLYGGAFGITVFAPIMTAEGPKAILDSQKDITTMLVLSIALGVIHIMIGLLTKAAVHIVHGRWFDAFCDSVLWIAAILSGIGLIVGAAGLLGEGAMAVCKWVLIASLVGLALTQGRSSPSLGGKIGNGLYGVYGISGYVGDLVSYTRIVALALSGAYIGYAFNTMIGILPGAAKIIGGVLIALVGHALNLGLAMLGAYVHTCRLQYVEFFSKFYEGGGVPFAPLRLKNEYTHITK